MKTKESTPLRKKKTGSTALVKATSPVLALTRRPPESVMFVYHDGEARRVCLAGSFNDWKPDELEMVHTGDGRWTRELSLPPGAHEYRFVVDGRWMADPDAERSAPNPFGEVNSVRIVPGASGTV